MTEIEAISKVMKLLESDSDFVSLLSKMSDGTTPMLIFGGVLPQEWGIKSKTVNLYVVTSSSQLEYDKYRFSASCRANTYAESRNLAFAMHRVLNRVNSMGFSILTTVLGTANPSDSEVDNYNTPVEILVRSS